MSFWTQPDEQETWIRPIDASKGASIGFLDGFQRAWNYGNLYESQFGVAMDLISQEQEMFQRIRAAGGEPPQSAFQIGDRPGTPYAGEADALARTVRDNDRRTYDEKYSTRDEELRVLQQRYPDAGIKTYGEMYRDTRGRYEKMKIDMDREYTTGGTVGWIAGEIASGVNPSTNPLSAMTLGIGGFGKTLAKRVATEGGAQGAIQALEEVTGVRENKRLLGENPSIAESFANIGLAAAGGSLLRLGGEAIGAGVRAGRNRWFKDLPNDPAPAVPPPPAATPAAPSAPVQRVPGAITPEADQAITRAVQEAIGGGRTTTRGAVTDYRHVAQALEDWQGPRPWEIAPPTASRIFEPAEAPRAPRPQPQTAGMTVDELARAIDPETFRVYDKLAGDVKRNRDSVKQALIARNIDAAEELRELDDQITAETAKLQNANKRKSKIYEERIRKLKDERAAKEAELLSADNSTAALHRQLVMRADEQMRDLAPAVSRAYARARSKWEAYDEQRAAIEKMMNEGATELPQDLIGPPAPTVIDQAEMMLQRALLSDSVSELVTAPKRQGEDAADVVKRVAQEDEKALDKALETFKSAIPKLIEAEGEDAFLDIDGVGKLSLSTPMRVVDEDTGDIRTLSVRDMLKEMQDDEDLLKVVSTCSVAKTSAPA